MKPFKNILLRFVAILLIVILTSAVAIAETENGNSFEVALIAYEFNDIEITPNNRGNRLPGQYVWEGYLDKRGYTNIPYQIQKYEIWDEKECNCLATFIKEEDFVECLHTLHGEYYIHLVTPNILYVGWISL